MRTWEQKALGAFPGRSPLSSNNATVLSKLEDSGGSSLVEFALICPLLLTIFGGLSDFGLMIWTRHRLASGVTQGAEYAFNTGPNVSEAAIRSTVKLTSALSEALVNVTRPSCYCLGGTPATLSLQNCGSPCADGTLPGQYVNISAGYTYQPMVPFFSNLISPSIEQFATVRIQ